MIAFKTYMLDALQEHGHTWDFIQTILAHS